MTRQANDAYIMAIIFTAKLRANAKVTGDLQDFCFPIEIAPSMTKRIAFGWQIIKRLD